MGLFRKEKKEVSEIDMELRKFPKKRREQLKKLYIEYQKGKVLRPGEDINNKEYISSIL
jgi:hypothetical protein